MSKQTYSLATPTEQHCPLVFASPHSGRCYPEGMVNKTILDDVAIRSSEDAYVDKLFDYVPKYGAPFLTAEVPRAYVDFNRSADELDPAVIKGIRGARNNPRVASGLGVVPRVVAGGRSIYREKLSWVEAHKRLESHWHPYHHTLKGLMAQTHAKFGQSILIDCHSMPREALNGALGHGKIRPDIVIGDRFGMAADGEIVDRVEAAFGSAGFNVARNAPFAGAHILQVYGRPAQNRHAVQIEIDRSIYMNEATLTLHRGFADVRDRLRAVVAEITAFDQSQLPLAAE